MHRKVELYFGLLDNTISEPKIVQLSATFLDYPQSMTSSLHMRQHSDTIFIQKFSK